MFMNAKKIQTKITIPIVVLALIIALSIGTFSTMVTRTSTMNALEKTLIETAELAASTLENTIATYRATLTEIASNDILTSNTATFEEKYDFLQERSNAHGFLTATLIDKNGDDPITGLNSDGQEYFERSMQGEFYLSSPYPYADGGSMYVVISAPVMKNGAVDSVICFTLDQSFLQNVVENIIVGESENGDVYILDKSGTTVASLEYELALNQENLFAELHNGTIGKGDLELAAVEQKMLTENSGIEEYADGDGINYMLSFARIGGSDGWSVAVCIDTAEFMRSATIGNYVLIAVSVCLVLICVVCARFVGKSIARPIVKCADRLKLLSEGDLKTPVPEIGGRDEVKMLAISTSELIESFSQIVDEVDTTLSNIANGDLSHDLDTVQYPGDFKSLKENLVVINARLNKTVGDIGVASDQVYTGAQQVSSGAQALAQGATQQASSVQELSATINEISDRIKNTAENAGTANQKTEQADKKLTECSEQMKALVAAMNDISTKSDEISKIIKVIEDIAVQTNLLALNAAVEAARAGAAGKGFAVVADEVRSLAGKSADASKSTSELIEGSAASVQAGMKILNQTVASLSDAVDSSQQSAKMILAISNDAKEQATAISQITEAIDQISSVVQTTSATSEESAATSEELSSQAQLLKGLVEQFVLKDSSPSDIGYIDDDYLNLPEEYGAQRNWHADKY